MIRFLSLLILAFTGDAIKKPLIFDTDYGSFIDDVFAMGLLVNSRDVVDLNLVVTTGLQPDLSARCVSAHLAISNILDIPVAVGAQLPEPSLRAGVCSSANLGISIEGECLKRNHTIIYNGIDYMAKMIMESGRNDWYYLVVGGQSSLRVLITKYPVAASKIDTVIVMGGNWCGGFEPYPGVMAPTGETNIGCDPGAANFVVDANNIKFNNVYYVPVELADKIGGDDYRMFVDAANSANDPPAAATLAWYKIWSEASRKDDRLLVHSEAMSYNPDVESTPQFDSVAVMLLLELLQVENCEKRISLFEFPGIHFSMPGGARFHEQTPSGFSLYPKGVMNIDLPVQCPYLTNFTFDLSTTSEAKYPVMVALGFNSESAKKESYRDMALRLAGQIPTDHCKPSTQGNGFIHV